MAERKSNAGRPLGSSNFYPNKKRLEQGFRDKGFDFVSEFVQLYRASDNDAKRDLLKHVTEFLFPKRRSEDEEGNPDSSVGEGVSKALIELQALHAKAAAERRGK